MKKYIIISLITGLSLASFAQQDPAYSQYMFNQQFINPAYAGSHDLVNATLLVRKQWLGFDGSPFTQFLSVDAPLKTLNSGIGLTVVNDRIGITNNTSFNGNYSYHIPLAGGDLSFGLRAGANYYAADLNDVQLSDENDRVYNNGITTTLSPNFGTGLFYHTERLFLGFAVPHIINYRPGTGLSAEGLQDVYQQERHYFLNGGYVIPISDNFMVRPSALVRYVDDAPVQADLNLNTLIGQVVWLGASYRTDASMVGIVAVQLTPRFKLGYSFDMDLTRMRGYNYGSHEVMLSLDFGKDQLKVKSPRFF